MSNELILSFGGSVKSLGDNRFGGYGVIFSDASTPDLDGEYFTSDTEFWLEDRVKLPVLYGHAQDKSIGTQRLGSVTFKQDTTGVWFEGELEARSNYIKKIMELIKAGKLGFSTAALGHLTEKVAGSLATWIRRWPIFELSLTPTPAEPRTAAIALKHYHVDALDEAVRKSKLSPSQLETEELRRHSEEIRRRVEETLNPSASVRLWAEEQTERGRRNSARAEAQREWFELRALAKTEMAKIDKLLAEATALHAQAGKEYDRREQSKHFRPGHNCGRLGCWTGGATWPY